MKIIMQGIALNKRVRHYIYPVDSSEETYVELLVKVGSEQDGNNRGVAHFLEHMLLGFDRVSKTARENYEYIWGNTSFTSTSFKIQLKRGQENSLKNSLKILRDICLGKTLDESLFGMILNDVIDEFHRFSFDKKESALLQELSYGKAYFPIGEKEYLYALDYGKVLSFFNRFYSNSPIALVVIENITYQYVESLIAEIFGSVNFGERPSSEIFPEVQCKEYCTLAYNTEKIFMIKRNMNNCSLKKRVVDDLSFIFCEDILERVYFTILDKKCDVHCKRIFYDSERQYVCIQLKSEDNAKIELENWHNIGEKLHKQAIEILSEELFEKIKQEYSLCIEKISCITSEQYIGEIEKNFLFETEIFEKQLYIDIITQIKYQSVYEEVIRLVNELSKML